VGLMGVVCGENIFTRQRRIGGKGRKRRVRDDSDSRLDGLVSLEEGLAERMKFGKTLLKEGGKCDTETRPGGKWVRST